MTYISQDVINEIIEKTDIVQLVGEYVKLDRKSSSNHFGLCPFHSEKTPSFSVSATKQIYYCFGCQKGGNAISFIQEVEGLSFPEAVEFLAKRLGITIKTNTDGKWQEREAAKKRQYQLMLAAARYYYRQFKAPAAQKYMQARGFTKATLKTFGVGYAGDGWDGLYRELTKQGFDTDTILASGLVRRSRKGGFYDVLRERVVFPIFNAFNDLIAFGGRIIVEGEPKYLNSPDTIIYNKGRQLFALNFARKSKEDYFILAEGYLDVISLYQAGFTNAVAGLGTAFTLEQARLLKRFKNKLILCYDADQAGRNATAKALKIAQNIGFDVKVIQIPQGKDPDEFISEFGAERFRALINEALPQIDYELKMILERNLGADRSLDAVNYQAEACKYLAAIDSKVTQEYYADTVSRNIGVPKDTVLRELARLTSDDQTDLETSPFSASSAYVKNNSEPKQHTVERSRNLPRFRLTDEEAILLTALALDNELLVKIKPQLTLEDFSKDIPRDFLSEVLRQVRDKNFNLPILISSPLLSGTEQETLGKQIMQTNLKIENYATVDLGVAAKHSVERMRQERIRENKEQILQLLANRNLEAAEREILLTELNRLIKENQ